MIQVLRTGIIDWANPKDFSLNNYSNDSSRDCFWEVNLDYPDELHDCHNAYVLAVEKIKVRDRTVVRTSITNCRRWQLFTW